MYRVEWQKRGLPHAHILLWLQDGIRPDQIDSVISAELPDPNQSPRIFEILSKHMIHCCGASNPAAICMKDNKCTKKFPRKFPNETQTGRDGYPLYKRRSPNEGGFSVTNTISLFAVSHHPLCCRYERRFQPVDYLSVCL